MAMKLEIIRRKLFVVMNAYLQNPGNMKMREMAQSLYFELSGLVPVLPDEMALAVLLLPDIGWDIEGPPKPSRKRIENLIEKITRIKLSQKGNRSLST